jgi:hypothetical protein
VNGDIPPGFYPYRPTVSESCQTLPGTKRKPGNPGTVALTKSPRVLFIPKCPEHGVSNAYDLCRACGVLCDHEPFVALGRYAELRRAASGLLAALGRSCAAERSSAVNLAAAGLREAL